MSGSLIIRVRALVAAVLSLAVTRTTLAQGIGVGAVAMFPRHDWIGNTLAGAGIRLQTKPTDGMVAAWELERVRGSGSHVFSWCSDLRLCPFERTRDDASLTVGSLAGSDVVLGGDRNALALRASLSIASIHIDSRGSGPGEWISDTRFLWGGSVGAEGGWSPFGSIPLSLEGSATIGFMRPFTIDAAVDEANPFGGMFTLSRLRLGLAWCGIAGGQVRDAKRRGCG